MTWLLLGLLFKDQGNISIRVGNGTFKWTIIFLYFRVVMI